MQNATHVQKSVYVQKSCDNPANVVVCKNIHRHPTPCHRQSSGVIRSTSSSVVNCLASGWHQTDVMYRQLAGHRHRQPADYRLYRSPAVNVRHLRSGPAGINRSGPSGSRPRPSPACRVNCSSTTECRHHRHRHRQLASSRSSSVITVNNYRLADVNISISVPHLIFHVRAG